jgi:hypothetical protein
MDCILIGGKPARLEPYIVVREQQNLSSEVRHCPVASVGEPLPVFRDSADRQPFSKRFHHIRSAVAAVVIDDQRFGDVYITTPLAGERL